MLTESTKVNKGDQDAQTKKRNMLKARLRRQCELKKGGKLLVPAWVHEMWKSGNKDELADTFASVNFNRDTRLQRATQSNILFHQVAQSQCSTRAHAVLDHEVRVLIWDGMAPSLSNSHGIASLLSLSGCLCQLLQEDSNQERRQEEQGRRGLVHKGRHGQNLALEPEFWPD